ncbi:MAG: response regulator [Gemmatimonadota bacterium]|nr:response regulator [Gemmatimonadota bacterium]
MQPTDTPAGRQPAEGAARILVADDRAPTREAAMRILSKAGFDVRGAEDGPGALESIESWGPDLVLLDVVMPGMDGLEVLERVRARFEFADTVMVLLSSFRLSPEDQAKGLEAGADGYIARPVDHQELLARVRTHLRTQQLARELRASEQRFRDLLDNQPDGVLVVDEAGIIQFANPAAEKLLSRPARELIGTDFGFPLTAGAETELDLTSSEGTRVVAMRVGDTTWDGRAAWLTTLRDETQRQAAAERMAEQAELLDRAQDAIFTLNLDGTIRFWNEGAQHLYGWPPDEVEGQSVHTLLFPSPQEGEVIMAQVLEQTDWRGEMEQCRRNGSTVTVEGRWSVVPDENGEPARILCVNTDVTEQKELLSQFLRAQRMESVGRLAGGIAHDLNNVLAPILMSIEMLQEDTVDPETLEILATVQESAQRGADLVKQVLLFSRGVGGARIAVDVAKTLQDLGRVVRDTFPKTIQLESRIPDDLWKIKGDPTQIHQVFMNLFVNARDAMPQGGRLRLEAANMTLDEQYMAMIGEATAGPHVRVTITDTGVGMSAEVLEMAFEPFFTTKEVGSGTGLGLSTVAAIIKSHGGLMNLSSEPRKGTTFQVFLPAEQSEATVEPASPPVERLLGCGELILVVDDERSIRSITQQTLEAFGYRAVTALDGADALAVYGMRGQEISAVLVDMMMPVMDGTTTIRALRRIDPDVPILASSGVAEHSEVARMDELAVGYFLSKPYTATDLLTALKEVLPDAE